MSKHHHGYDFRSLNLMANMFEKIFLKASSSELRYDLVKSTYTNK